MPEPPNIAQKNAELQSLRQRIAELEDELAGTEANGPDWRSDYYLTYYATTGFFLGMIGAVTSLIFNVIGALLFGKHPLELIRVYLTFGMGEKAFQVEEGITLAIGCCLYIATGMLLGVPFHVVLTRFTARRGLVARLLAASLLALAIWLINFYLLLSWIQPLLFGGNWIIDPKYLPPWVAALTHLVFGWTMAVVYPWGLFEPYRVQSE